MTTTRLMNPETGGLGPLGPIVSYIRACVYLYVYMSIYALYNNLVGVSESYKIIDSRS